VIEEQDQFDAGPVLEILPPGLEPVNPREGEEPLPPDVRYEPRPEEEPPPEEEIIIEDRRGEF
jgi:hypothetical protein